jgi:hypothetical protein
MLKTYGGDLGTNLPKWRLVLGWKNDSLMQLFVDDLKIAVEGQKAALIQQAEAQALAAQAPKDAPASP